MIKEQAEQIFELALMTGRSFRKLAAQVKKYPGRKIFPVIDRRPLKRIQKQIIKDHNQAIMAQLGLQGLLAAAQCTRVQSQPGKIYKPGAAEQYGPSTAEMLKFQSEIIAAKRSFWLGAGVRATQKVGPGIDTQTLSDAYTKALFKDKEINVITEAAIERCSIIAKESRAEMRKRLFNFGLAANTTSAQLTFIFNLAHEKENKISKDLPGVDKRPGDPQQSPG